MFFIAIFIILLGVLLLVGVALKNKQQQEKPAISKIEYKYKTKPLMTDNEFEFFNRLVKALPDYYIFPQVSFGAILQADTNDLKEKNRIRLTFAQKMADYVIYNKQQKIIAIVELDDKTHNQEKDDKRDAMLKQAGYKSIRFNSKQKPSIEAITKIIKEI